MSNFSAFMKQNKIERANTKYKATKSLCDENGVPLDWEIKPLDSQLVSTIRGKCTKLKQVGNQVITEVDQQKFEVTLIAASVVYPNLEDAELQNSYGVYTPTDLIYAMVDNPNEFGNFLTFIQEFNNFETIDEKVEQAKN